MPLPVFITSLINNRAARYALIAVSAAAAYSNSLGASFHFDDKYAILGDAAVRNFSVLEILSQPLSRPILRLTFALNYALGTESVTGYHIVNLGLHILTAISVMLLASLLVRTFHNDDKAEKLRALPLVSALIFTLHPAMTGSVTYIASRSSILVTLFIVLSIGMFLRAEAGKAPKTYYIISAILALLAFGSKEIAVTIPPLLILFLFIRHKSDALSFLKKYAALIVPLIIIIAAYAAYRKITLGAVVPFDPRIDEGILAPYQYFLTELNVIVFHYLKWLILPFGAPHPDPDIAATTTLANISTLAAGVIIIAFLTAAIIYRKRHPVLSFAILWFFISLLPTSSIFPIGDVAVERHLYLPMFGFALAAGYAAAAIYTKLDKKILAAAVSATFIVLAALTVSANSKWRSEVTLWEHAIKESPDKVRVLNNRAWGHYLAGDYETSLKLFNGVIERFPEYPYARHNIAIVYMTVGRPDLAIPELKTAIALRPGAHFFRTNLALAYEAAGLYDEAIAEHGILLETRPSDPAILTSMASTLAKKGDFRNCLSSASKAAATAPDNAMALYVKGYCLEMTGNKAGAMEAYNRALAIVPSWELPRTRLANLAR